MFEEKFHPPCAEKILKFMFLDAIQTGFLDEKVFCFI